MTTAAELNKRRVSYVIPAPEGYTPPCLELPAFGTGSDSRSFPLLTPKSTPLNGTSPISPQFASRNPFAASAAGLSLGPAADLGLPPSPSRTPSSSHPQHRLGVSCLALDTSTVLHGADSPGGILYTGGRDGLVASWELHVPHSKRRGRCYRPVPNHGTGQRVRWERIGDGGADWDGDDDDNDDQGSVWSTSSDEDDFYSPAPVDTNGSGGKQRRQVAFENRWEVDKDAIARRVSRVGH
jgi:WD repeat-containing protein 48